MGSLIKCRICGVESDHERFMIREMMLGARDRFSYFKCGGCGCLQIESFPADLAKYYPNDYYSFSDMKPRQKGHFKSYLWTCRDRYAVFGKGTIGRIMYGLSPNTLLNIFSKVRLNAASRILDVGCGSGRLLRDLRRVGMVDLKGVDPFIEADIHEPDIDITKTTIFDVREEYDLIIFYHTLEHMPDPERSLSAARGLLAQNGTCIVAVPLVDSWAWYHYGVNWVQIDAPRHFFIYSKKSMQILADKAGLFTKETLYNSTELQFLGSEQYEKDIPLNAPNSYFSDPARSVFDKEQVKSFSKKAEALNKVCSGDQAVFYMQKAERP